MRKRIASVLLAFSLLLSCITAGVGGLATSARDAGVGTGAESSYLVDFSLSEEISIGKNLDVLLNVSVMDSNYNARINFISAYVPYYTEGGISYLDVSYSIGTIVSDSTSFAVTGRINEDANSVVRYTVTYDILDKSGNVVWKNLTGYTYGFVSGSEATTGAVGTYHAYPGQLSDGCYFEVLETLNTTYVQQSEISLTYKIRTQTGLTWNYSDARTRGVNVISGNPPSTLDTMPDNNGAARDGQMDWPKADAIYRSAGGRWLSITEPPSGYYNFTISFNSWNDDWEDQSNITETTEIYFLSNADKVAALGAANKIMKVKNTFADGYYVQKGLYTEQSWNNLINALDIAYQVAYSVENANYGYKLACQQASSAAAAVDAAFAGLERAEHDFDSYSEPIVTEPTCTEPGSRKLTCICGEVKTEEIPAKGHVQGDWHVVKEATCTEDGLEELRCSVCNDVIKERILGTIAHPYIRTTVAPTCVDNGYMINKCFACGDTYISNYVDPLGHSYQTEVIEPTCTEKGCNVHICYVCSASYIDGYTDIVPHNYDAQVTAPTCTEAGYTTYTCVDCFDTRVDDYVDATGHDYKVTVIAPTVTDNGYTFYKCKNCDYNYSADYVPALGETVTVSGTVKSFATNAENSETAETKIELIKAGEEEASYSVTVAGTGVQSYAVEDVSKGEYVLRVTKENHATREYEIVVTSDDVTCELVIHLMGDINGDGRVNTIDAARVNAHAKGVTALTGYEVICSDVNGDGKNNTIDVARINAHAKSVTLLW